MLAAAAMALVVAPLSPNQAEALLRRVVPAQPEFWTSIQCPERAPEFAVSVADGLPVESTVAAHSQTSEFLKQQLPATHQEFLCDDLLPLEVNACNSQSIQPPFAGLPRETKPAAGFGEFDVEVREMTSRVLQNSG